MRRLRKSFFWGGTLLRLFVWADLLFSVSIPVSELWILSRSLCVSRLHQQKKWKKSQSHKVQLLIAALALCNGRALLISQVWNLLSRGCDVEGTKTFSDLSSWLLQQSQMLGTAFLLVFDAQKPFRHPSVFIEHSFSFYHSIFMLILECHISKMWWKCQILACIYIYFLNMFSHSLEVLFDIRETELRCKLRDGRTFAERWTHTAAVYSDGVCRLHPRKNNMSVYVAKKSNAVYPLW